MPVFLGDPIAPWLCFKGRLPLTITFGKWQSFLQKYESEVAGAAAKKAGKVGAGAGCQTPPNLRTCDFVIIDHTPYYKIMRVCNFCQ